MINYLRWEEALGHKYQVRSLSALNRRQGLANVALWPMAQRNV
jgi:hypothetical protein